MHEGNQERLPQGIEVQRRRAYDDEDDDDDDDNCFRCHSLPGFLCMCTCVRALVLRRRPLSMLHTALHPIPSKQLGSKRKKRKSRRRR